MGDKLSHSDGSWVARLSREFYTLLWNLTCGIKIMAFRRSAFERLLVSYDQLALLLLLYAVTLFVGSYSLVVDPQFSVWGMGYLGVDLLISLLIGYVIVKASGSHTQLLLFLMACYSIAPFAYLIFEIVLPRLPESVLYTASIAVSVWFLAVMLFITYVLVGRRKLRALGITFLWILVLLPTAEILPKFWYENYNYEAEVAAYEPIDAEKVYYSQYELLDLVLDPIQPGVRGVTDLYFVGFGSYAAQDVFMKEVTQIQQVADSRLGTRERSVTLINNGKTLDSVPLASSTNLGIVLRDFGKLMNPDEDVLFLYLTSHGSKNHELSVDMWPLGLNDIRPEDIKAHLDAAGIRWRIILVSACYSGGFVEPLKDDNSVILTASAHDKTSFGCSNENEFTYFGEALFKDVAEGPYQFIPRFEDAITAIEQREKSEGLEFSEPQLHVGVHMRDKLLQLESEMSRYPLQRFQK